MLPKSVYYRKMGLTGRDNIPYTWNGVYGKKDIKLIYTARRKECDIHLNDLYPARAAMRPKTPTLYKNKRVPKPGLSLHKGMLHSIHRKKTVSQKPYTSRLSLLSSLPSVR